MPSRSKNLAIALIAIVTACNFQVGTLQAKKFDGDRLLDPDHLLDIRIKLPASDWAELCQQTRNVGAVFSGAPMDDPFSYVKADIWIDDIKIESVGIRKKGFIGSLDNQRPSLKISFDEFVAQDPIKGLSRLTLNNNKQDTSQVSQFLTYKLFRDAGVHAPRCNFARVTVNDEYLGIYTHVESVKKPFLAEHFGDKTGNLYEGTLTDFHPKSVDKLEAKTNEELNDRSDILRLTNVLAAPGDLSIAEIEQIIDLDNFLNFWVVEGMIRFWDGYASNQNNYFYYVNPKNQRGYFIPWGADGSFSQDGGPFGRFNNQSSTSIYAQSILANRLYHTDGIPDRYRTTMLRLLDEVWNEQELVAQIDRIERLISAHLHPSQRDTPRAMNNIKDFIHSRRQVLKNELSQWPADVPAEPRKPMYVVKVGQASGSFNTVWSEAGRGNTAAAGSTDVQIKLDDQIVAMRQLGVTVQTFEMPRFGGPGGFGGGGFGGGGNPTPPISFVFSGIRDDGQPLTITLIVDRQSFENAKVESVNVNGSLSEGPQGRFGFGGGGFGGGGKSVNGQLRLTKAGTADGDEVAGTIDLQIVEVHGGFFNQGRPAAPQRPQPGAFPRPVPPFQQALDSDGDGKLSAGEMEKAASSLQGLDRNSDGELTLDELMFAPPPN